MSLPTPTSPRWDADGGRPHFERLWGGWPGRGGLHPPAVGLSLPALGLSTQSEVGCLPSCVLLGQGWALRLAGFHKETSDICSPLSPKADKEDITANRNLTHFVEAFLHQKKEQQKNPQKTSKEQKI